MACTCPIPAWPAPPGAPDRTPVFGAFRSYDGARSFEVPCGQCISCRRDKAQSWGVRCMHELQMAGGLGYFVTWTYDNEHIPQGASLWKPDLQNLHKALRYHLGPFRFLACGEYGEVNSRPHYHGVYIGQEITDLVPAAPGQSGLPQFSSELLTRCWGKGLVTVAHMTMASACYVAGYATKKAYGKSGEDYLRRWDSLTGEVWHVAPEFLLMSRRPGLGKSWFDRYADDAFPSDFVTVEGRKVPVPGYYLTLLAEREALRVQAARKAKRRKAMQLRPDEQSDLRLRTKHASKQLRAAGVKRDLD